jgi:hypothetical protein
MALVHKPFPTSLSESHENEFDTLVAVLSVVVSATITPGKVL